MIVLPDRPHSPGLDPDVDQGVEDSPKKESRREINHKWLKKARQAFESSTTYVDSSYRTQWDNGIRAFNNQHAASSKYLSTFYDKRSRLYRPKTRSTIRKGEAAAASAFFSNVDIVNVEAQNQADKAQMASAEVMKELLQYRLTKSLKFFQFTIGGFQDAQTVGASIAHVYWRYEEMGEKKIDQPCLDLVPIENFRIDPASDWMDPINTSPYIIHMMPMYVIDIKRKMGKGWYELDDTIIRSARQQGGDSTRMARNRERQDANDADGRVQDYEIAWVHRHIHRDEDGQDWEFYTLESRHMLSSVKKLDDVVFHGRRPYVMGSAILETHKIYPAGVPYLIEGLQNEINELANQRIDNVKFVLNKRWLVRRGKNVDLPSMVRNVPGGVTLVDDVELDVKEINFPDVTSSAYQEQDRLNADLDELAGNFSIGSIDTNRRLNETAKGMQMASSTASVMTEYSLRTYVETFVLPVLRQLVLLEQEYETDTVVYQIAAERAQVLQRFGMEPRMDEVLDAELTLSVNVGMGQTDPNTKLQKFAMALSMLTGMAKQPIPGIDLREVGKEIFALSGYQDGRRFFGNVDPAIKALQTQLQQMGMAMKQMEQKVKEKEMGHMVNLKKSQETNQTRKEVEIIRGEYKKNGDNPEAEHQREMQKMALEDRRAWQKMKAEIERDMIKMMMEMWLKAQESAAKVQETQSRAELNDRTPKLPDGSSGDGEGGKRVSSD